MSSSLREILVAWAVSKPSIKSLSIFGSYANGGARPDSDLDLAFEFDGVDNEDSELIENAASWKQELTSLTGLIVKDLYRRTASIVASGPTLLVFDRCS